MIGLILGTEVRDRLVEHVAWHGRRGNETGGFFLARDGCAVLALSGQKGIRRSPMLFTVSTAAIDRLFSWAADQGFTIAGQVHSHRRGAFLSKTDVEHGFAVEGFTTCVIPDFAAPAADPTRWGWWQYRTGQWLPRDAPSLSKPVASSVMVFDEGAVTRA